MVEGYNNTNLDGFLTYLRLSTDINADVKGEHGSILAIVIAF